jgi:hypothetical protein
LEIIPQLEFGLNNGVNASTRLTPFFINKGLHPLSPVDLLLKASCRAEMSADSQSRATPKEASCRAAMPADLKEFTTKLKEIHVAAGLAIKAAQLKMKKYYDAKHKDAPVLAVGDQVMLHAEQLTAPNHAEKDLPSKLRAVWSGPFPITAVLEHDTYRLKLPSSWRMHPEVHVSKLKPYHEDLSFDYREEHVSPPAWDLDEEAADGELQAILKARCVSEKSKRPLEFFCVWKGEPASEGRWLTFERLQGAKALVKEFLLAHPELNQHRLLQRLHLQ